MSSVPTSAAGSAQMVAVGASKHLKLPWLLWACLLTAAIGYGYGALGVPLQGEESRWARGAEWMLLSGDWIVPRQQGTVFPERPPMNSWLMAVGGLARGWVDPVAVRLPSIVAVLATMWLLYAYGKRMVGHTTGILAAVIYGSLGQVLQLGRRGESEAVFTLLLAASLLVWHASWEAKRPAWQSWVAGFSLAALAALTKGLQGPVYFVAATAAYLWWTGNLPAIITRAYALGVVTLAAIVGAWFVPFVWMTDATAAADIWTGLARDRVGIAGLVKHLASYPFETAGCLLPWSPLLLQFGYRHVRIQVTRTGGTLLSFLICCLAVTYPTMLAATGARGRYYMPLYPIIALLIAHGISLTMETTGGWAKSGFRLWQYVMAGVMMAVPGALLAMAYGWLPFGWSVHLVGLESHLWLLLVLAILVVGLVRRYAKPSRGWELAPVAIGCWIMLAYGLLWMPITGRQLNDLTLSVEKLKLQHGIDSLSSLGPIYHRFAYYCRTPIRELSWPESRSDVPDDIEFFCFGRLRNDTNERRAFGRGRSWRPVEGRVPFRWVEIARINCDPPKREQANRVVIIGKIVRDADGDIVWHDRFPAVDLPPTAIAHAIEPHETARHATKR